LLIEGQSGCERVAGTVWNASGFEVPLQFAVLSWRAVDDQKDEVELNWIAVNCQSKVVEIYGTA
jgi:hypothetical protein